ncbi:hypothetical protein ACQ4M3_23490 [Leptolyngbya sp. AN03gr2]|uniref:hypothetical protein n=1 Tax=Leptolyngbya sp. AN03gr2 TaxID=3423364 RepID=UPI003D323040
MSLVASHELSNPLAFAAALADFFANTIDDEFSLPIVVPNPTALPEMLVMSLSL